jgi:hypothetical protein
MFKLDVQIKNPVIADGNVADDDLYFIVIC